MLQTFYFLIYQNMKNFFKKFSNSLISGIWFWVGFLMIIWIYLVYATGVFNLPSQVSTWSWLSATEWNKMVGSLDNLNSRFTQENWQTSAFQNWWVDYWAWYSTAWYFKDNFWIVHLKWIIKNWTIWACAFYLPIWYRPIPQLILSATSHNWTTYVLTRLDILPGWCVIPNVWANWYFSLDWVTFRAEQ